MENINLDTITYEEWLALDIPVIEGYVNREFTEDQLRLVSCIKLGNQEYTVYERFQKYWRIRGGRAYADSDLSEYKSVSILMDYATDMFDVIDWYRFKEKIRSQYFDTKDLSSKRLAEIILECIDNMQCRYSIIIPS